MFIILITGGIIILFTIKSYHNTNSYKTYRIVYEFDDTIQLCYTLERFDHFRPFFTLFKYTNTENHCCPYPFLYFIGIWRNELHVISKKRYLN